MPLQLVPLKTTVISPAPRQIRFQFLCASVMMGVIMVSIIQVPSARRFMPSLTLRALIGCVLLAFFLCAGAGELVRAASFSARAETAFTEAQRKVRQQPSNTLALVELARTAFEWAEFSRRDEDRADLAQRGQDAARLALTREETNAAAHYWLGMNLGQMARTKSLGALKLVREMESEFLRAISLDEHLAYAGPNRTLGILYRDAPGWPTSIGSTKKARQHLERAVQLHPEFPENQLGLLESFEQWGNKQDFARQLKAAEKTLTESRAKFSGPDWEASWADWEKQFAALLAKAGVVGKLTPSKGAR